LCRRFVPGADRRLSVEAGRSESGREGPDSCEVAVVPARAPAPLGQRSLL
jgi:hypothetical protein